MGSVPELFKVLPSRHSERSELVASERIKRAVLGLNLTSKKNVGSNFVCGKCNLTICAGNKCVGFHKSSVAFLNRGTSLPNC